MTKKIIVIGSGFGGLATAIRLAAKGHQVEIFEKRDKLGGRAYVYEINSFKFDGGPTVITAPFMFDDLFEAAGRRREDYVTFVPCNPYYRIYNHEGRHFDYNGDEAFILSQIEKWTPPTKKAISSLWPPLKPSLQKVLWNWPINRSCLFGICSRWHPI